MAMLTNNSFNYPSIRCLECYVNSLAETNFALVQNAEQKINTFQNNSVQFYNDKRTNKY